MSNAPPHDESFRREIDARVGRTLCQRYTLEAVLGVGPTGAVYRGTHRSGNRVAVKVLHTELCASSDLREAFLREAKVASRVEHPGAVRILDDDTAEDGTVFLVMDLLEGETLEARLRRSGGRLAASALAPVIGQLLDVLAAAHAKGIVHRGVEPSNVFLASDGTVKLLGFGTARLADGSRLPARIGRALEAAAFLAPEQARGEAMNVDPRTDLWATGAVMLTAIAGAFVYPAATPEMMRARAATEAAPPLRSLVPNVEPDVAEIVDRALAARREERWIGATAMAAALRSARLAGGASVPPPPMPSQQPPRMPSQQPPPMMVPAGSPLAQAPYPPPQGQAPPQVPMAQAPMPGFGAPPPEDNGWVKWVAIAAGLVVLFVMGAGVMGFLAYRISHRAKTDAGAEKAALVWSDEASPVPVSSRDPVWGERAAPVTIVVFSDFQCPFCAKVEPTLDRLKADYGPDKIRIVWKNQPLSFHANAKPAAEAAQVVFSLKGSTAFFTFHDLAFQNQAQLTPENFRAWALAAGADGRAFDKAMAAHAGASKVEEDMELGKKVGATGTPTFRINGLLLTGAQPFEQFKTVIDAELGKAATTVASGTPKDQVYVVLSSASFTQPAVTAKKPDEPPPDTTTVWRVPVKGSPIRGNVDAPVTVVEFGDFQCPFCKRAETTVDKIRDTYADRVRIVWKHQPLPFHNRAEPSAELAIEARAQKGDAGFWRAHDKLFDAQPKLEDDDLARIGVSLGLDGGRVKTAIRDKKHAREIDADLELADDVQATGTPHFFVNGRRLSGAQPFDAFQKIIDDELRKFDAQKGNVAAKDWYEHLMRDAKGAPEPERRRAPAVPASSPFRGGRNAKVVIQEWADFQCPFCARVEPTLVEIQKLYGDRVKIVWRDKPLAMHPDAANAAELAREALAEKGPEGFARMHDKLFANQQRLKRDDLDGYATELGLDPAKVARALDGKTHSDVIDADDKLSVDLGFTGTPTFLINDYVLNGAQPLAKFRKLIDRALADTR